MSPVLVGVGFGVWLGVGVGVGVGQEHPLHSATCYPARKVILIGKGVIPSESILSVIWLRPNIAVAWPSDLIPYFNVEH